MQMSKMSRKKTLCKHDWSKIKILLENNMFQEVIEEIDIIDSLTDLWYIIDANLGLGKLDKAEELLNIWKYQISNPMSESYWIFYEALIKIQKNQLEEAKLALEEALEIAKREDAEKIAKKILSYLKRIEKPR